MEYLWAERTSLIFHVGLHCYFSIVGPIPVGFITLVYVINDPNTLFIAGIKGMKQVKSMHQYLRKSSMEILVRLQKNS